MNMEISHGVLLAVTALCIDQVAVPDVAIIVPGHVATGPLHHQAGVHVGAGFQGLVGVDLERGRAAAADTLVCGDQRLAVGVLDAVFQGVGRETTEHD